MQRYFLLSSHPHSIIQSFVPMPAGLAPLAPSVLTGSGVWIYPLAGLVLSYAQGGRVLLVLAVGFESGSIILFRSVQESKGKEGKKGNHSFFLFVVATPQLPWPLFSIFLLPNRLLPVYQLYACFVLELEILACSSSYYIRAFGLHSLPLSAPLLACYSSLFLAFPFSPCLSSIDLIRHFLLFINLSPYFRHACNGLLSPDRYDLKGQDWILTGVTGFVRPEGVWWFPIFVTRVTDSSPFLSLSILSFFLSILSFISYFYSSSSSCYLPTFVTRVTDCGYSTIVR